MLVDQSRTVGLVACNAAEIAPIAVQPTQCHPKVANFRGFNLWLH